MAKEEYLYEKILKLLQKNCPNLEQKDAVEVIDTVFSSPEFKQEAVIYCAAEGYIDDQKYRSKIDGR